MSNDGKVIVEDEPPSSGRAQKEAVLISEGNLKRDEAVRTHIHRAGLCVFWVFVTLMMLFSSVWAYHLVMPERLKFLDEKERDALQTVLFTAIASSFATQLTKRWETPALHPTPMRMARFH